MKSVYIPCEYILSPILGDDIEDISLKLIQFKNIISRGIVDLNYEYDIVGKLNSNNLYPTEKHIQRKLNTLDDCTFSAKDISKTINWILSNIENELPEGIIDWEECNQYPACSNIYPQRAEDFKIFLDSLIINIETTKNDGKILIELKDIPDILSIKGKVKNSDPPIVNNNINRDIHLTTDSTSCISDIDFLSYYKSSNNNEDLKFAIFCESIKRNPNSSNPAIIEHLHFSTSFIESAQKNQAINGPFSETTFNKIVEILEKFLKFDNLTPFRESQKSSKQKMQEGHKAYREHITSSGVGLRLMFWINNDNKRIEFSRIGPKHELLINDPEF